MKVAFSLLLCGWLVARAAATATATATAVPDTEENAIPGSSDYVPEKSNVPAAPSGSTTNDTHVNANVFKAKPDSDQTGRDPLQVNAQSQSPFLAGRGINPQIAMLLRNNPRLQMLARQNPVIAQQIMRNPQLLQDPMVQRAIQSRLAPGQAPNLLGQLGQLGISGLNGLGRALNPLGLPLSPGGLQNRPGLPGMGDARSFGRPLRNQQPQNHHHHHHQQQQPVHGNAHQDTLNGGYYGDNENYLNRRPAAHGQGIGHGPAMGHDTGVAHGQDAGNELGDEDAAGQPDYDGGNNPGGENEGEAENEGEGQGEAEQNPAEDPDIQQLQNFGGPMNDNFPESLFPPGLLTKEDIDEIRRQQEKQQREAEERERLQQQQQNQQQETASPDYPEEVTDGGEDTTTEYPTGADDGTTDPNGLEQDYTTTTSPEAPAAYHNAYQPIQPDRREAPVVPVAPVQPRPARPPHQFAHHARNRFNVGPSVDYGGHTTVRPAVHYQDHFGYHPDRHSRWAGGPRSRLDARRPPLF